MTPNSLRNSLLIMLAACAGACAKTAENVESVESPVSQPQNAAVSNCPTIAAHVLHGHLYGALDFEISAAADEVECKGMPRPADRGVRLQFELSEASQHGGLVLIIGIDGIDRSDTGQAIRSTVTVIDEGNNRFFSTGTQQSCYTDIEQHDYRAADRVSDIGGVVWCTAAIPEVNGSDSIRLTELRFAGRVSWPGAG